MNTFATALAEAENDLRTVERYLSDPDRKRLPGGHEKSMNHLYDVLRERWQTLRACRDNAVATVRLIDCVIEIASGDDLPRLREMRAELVRELEGVL